MAIYNAAWAIPFLPLLGALVSLGVETQRRAAQLCVFFTGLSFVVAAIVLGVRLTHATGAPFESLLTFFAMTPPEGAIFATQFQAQVGDPRRRALGELRRRDRPRDLGDPGVRASPRCAASTGFRRFFCGSSALAFCTTGFVLSPNLFDSLITWVGASASLYVLISLSWQRADVARHAMRAMVVLTAGDIALTLGVVFAWIKFGVFSSLLQAPAGQTIADPFSFNVISQGVIATLHHGVANTGPRAILVMGIVFLVAACRSQRAVSLHRLAHRRRCVGSTGCRTCRRDGRSARHLPGGAHLPGGRARAASAARAGAGRRPERRTLRGDRHRPAQHHAHRRVRGRLRAWARHSSRWAWAATAPACSSRSPRCSRRRC